MPSAYKGTDIIMSAANNKVPGYPLEIFDFVSGSGSYIMLAKQAYHTARRISYRVSDISLKNITFYDIILMKKGVFMSENKLLDLSFEFAVAIVNLVDGVTAPKSSYMTDQLARSGTSVGANIHESCISLHLSRQMMWLPMAFR